MTLAFGMLLGQGSRPFFPFLGGVGGYRVLVLGVAGLGGAVPVYNPLKETKIGAPSLFLGHSRVYPKP